MTILPRKPDLPRKPGRASLSWAIVTAAIAVGAALAAAGIGGSLGAEALRERARKSLQVAAALVADDMGKALETRLATLDRLGHRYLTMALQDDPARLQVWLDELRHTMAGVAWVGIASPRGVVLAGNDRLLVGRDVSAEDWYRRGLRGPAMIDVRPPEPAALREASGAPAGAGERLIDLATPMVLPDGRLAGVIGLHLHWDWMAGRLAAVARPFEAGAPIRTRLLAAGGAVLAETQFGSLPAPGAAGLVEVEMPLRAGIVPRDLGWRVVVERPLAAVEAPARAFALRAGLVSGGLGLLATLLAALARHRLQRGLAAAKEAAFSFARLVPGGASNCCAARTAAGPARCSPWMARRRPGTAPAPGSAATCPASRPTSGRCSAGRSRPPRRRWTSRRRGRRR